MFKYPVDGAKLTSPFGKDILNGVTRMHNGVDLAKAGTVMVKAAADGVVSRSDRSDSYGEVIFIVHSIGGKTYETVYSHMRTGSRKVFEGAKVKQGQALGLMGNTGYSFGQHLHFELHVGRWNMSKSNAVDPLKYLGKSLAASSNIKGKLVSNVAKLKFYNKPSWNAKDVAGYLTKDIGFPTIVRKLKVDDAYQYEVKNSKGHTYYVTASSKYVKVK